MKKSTSSAASTPFPGSLSHSAGRVGENPGSEVAAGSSLISGGGGWRGETEFVSFFFFFKFVANKYVLNWRVFPTKTHP